MLSKKLLTAAAVYLAGASALTIPNIQILDLENALEIATEKASKVAHLLVEHAGNAHQIVFGGDDSEGWGEYVAPLLNQAAESIIPNKYIVVLHDHVDVEEAYSMSMYSTLGIEGSDFDFFDVTHLRGFVGMFTEESVRLIQQDPRVKFIEHDTIFKVNDFDIQEDAPWGLSRVSHRKSTDPISDYLYDNEGGEGVTAYVIDTGIKVEHEEFEGRASWGSAVALPHLKVDGHGHGTHCAGIIGSKTYGIAKKVDLVAVGVMSIFGTGSTSDIIKGIEFVVNDHQSKVQSKVKGFKGSTINMSIGGGASDALDLAANAATRAGLHVAIAAGNDNADACEYSPARATGPITVGATNVRDERASFSNWGNCVDIFAPGEDIESTFIWSKSTSMSGTSMASPHIAGLLSYYLSLYPGLDSEYSNGKPLEPAVLKQKLIKYGTKGVISNLVDGSSPNVLAFNGAGGNLTDFWNL